jgi:hypothetical protein
MILIIDLFLKIGEEMGGAEKRSYPTFIASDGTP